MPSVGRSLAASLSRSVSATNPREHFILMTRFLIASKRTAVITAAVLLAGCSGLLDVTNPNNVVEDALGNPGAATAIANGAGATVTRALTAILAPYGAVTDELTYVGSRDAYGYADKGEVSDPFNEFADAAFPEMAEARWTTGKAVLRLNDFNADNSLTDKNDLARAYLYQSIIFTAIGEMFDDFVIDADKTVAGPSVGEGNMSVVFDSAITQATAGLAVPGLSRDNKIRLLAMRARAKHSKAIWGKLNGSGGAPATTPVASPLVNDAGADADAAAALTEIGTGVDYKFKLTPQTQTLGFPNVGNDLNNRLELRTGDFQAGARPADCTSNSCDSWVDPNGAGNAIDSTTYKDPVSNIIDPVFRANITECCVKGTQNGQGDLVALTIVSAREMLLIRAEHALANGNTAGFTTFINQIRAFNSTLAPYAGTPAAQAMLTHTRFVNLYNQGKRLMDMHRFGIKARKWVPASEAYAKACFFPVMNIERSTHPDDFVKPLCRP
jgi:starch-binding outer membrane protein, SusD/RagB family